MKQKVIFPVLYIFLIVFITIVLREESLARPINVAPFRSYIVAFGGNSQQISQILLNIMLFIPLGYLFKDVFSGKTIRTICLATVVSTFIEFLQFYTCRGQFDVDDIINNSIGAGLGILLRLVIRNWKWRKCIPYILCLAGLAGCVIAASPTESPFPVNYTKQFNFHIEQVNVSDGNMEIFGTCTIYGRKTPGYDLLLDHNIPLDTEVIGSRLSAVGSLDNIDIGKHEIFIHFHGYHLVSTGTYINLKSDGSVEITYVSGDYVIPFCVPDHYIFKAYNAKQETYVFEDMANRKILWYIGWEITPSTEVIYHIHTNEPKKLPENRVRYGYDNRGFRVRASNTNELQPVGKYRVFECEIPDAYHVISVTVGFNTDGTITWIHYFRIE